MIDLNVIKTHVNNLHVSEAKMLKCNHVTVAGPSGYGTCTKCGFSELIANYNMYNNKELNK
jgi:hypothetical protein